MRERELDKELRDHVERHVADLVLSGMPEQEARRHAMVAFGGMEAIKEECRETWRWAWMTGFTQDLRFAARGMRRNRPFAAAAMLTIALATGGASAVFSVVDRSLFRALPYGHEARLVSVGMVAPVIHSQDWMFAGTYQQWKATQTALEEMTAWRGVSDCDRSDGTPERLGCAEVEANFLTTLGVRPALGRGILPEEDTEGGAAVALLTHGYWQRRFGGDPGAVGMLMKLNGMPTRIIGVLPAEFETPSLAAAQVMTPLRLRRDSQRQRLVHVIGRMRAGETAGRTAQQLEPMFAAFLGTSPADFRRAVPMRLRVAGLREQQTREYRLALWTLLGAVLSFVLLACANVANLLLARTAARRHEFAVRASLGASKWRLVRQTMTESLLLGVGGGAAGAVLGWGLLRVFQQLAPDGTPRMGEAAMDGRVMLFTGGLALAAAMLFGLAPAVERMRSEALAEARVAGRRRNRMQAALVAVQLAVAATLLISTGLFLVSLWRMQQAPAGFGTDGVVTATFLLPAAGYGTDEKQLAFFGELERRLVETPGFAAAAITDTLPPGGDPRSRPYVAFLGGGDAEKRGLEGMVKWRYVTAGYFDVMGIRVRGGLRPGAGQSIVVSETLARRLFGDEDPVGRTVRLEEPMVITGVAADARNAGMRQAADGEFYVLRGREANGVYRNQRPPYGWRRATAIVRTELAAGVAMELLRGRIGELDPGLAVVTGTLEDEVRPFYARPRFETFLLAAFAVLGLVLAGVGLYGLTAFRAAERTREIGVRIALGASPAAVMRLMMGDGLRWTAAGMVAGAVITAAVARGLRALLYGVDPLDWRVFGAAAAVLAAVAVAGTWAPSARAARMAPMEALRRE